MYSRHTDLRCMCLNGGCTWAGRPPPALSCHRSPPPPVRAPLVCETHCISPRNGDRACMRRALTCAACRVQMASINLCPNIVGQLGIALMTNEPQPGDVSYDSWNAEKQGLLDSMRRKAHMMTDFFNSLDGVACTFTEGAMYSFPLITCAPPPPPPLPSPPPCSATRSPTPF